MNYLDNIGLNPEEFVSGGKPEESFSQLIKRAIESSPRQRLFLIEIYAWILENYPYFKQVDPGWRVNKRFHRLFCNHFPLEFGETFTFNYKGLCKNQGNSA